MPAWYLVGSSNTFFGGNACLTSMRAEKLLEITGKQPFPKLARNSFNYQGIFAIIPSGLKETYTPYITRIFFCAGTPFGLLNTTGGVRTLWGNQCLDDVASEGAIYTS